MHKTEAKVYAKNIIITFLNINSWCTFKFFTIVGLWRERERGGGEVEELLAMFTAFDIMPLAIGHALFQYQPQPHSWWAQSLVSHNIIWTLCDNTSNRMASADMRLALAHQQNEELQSCHIHRRGITYCLASNSWNESLLSLWHSFPWSRRHLLSRFNPKKASQCDSCSWYEMYGLCLGLCRCSSCWCCCYLFCSVFMN